MSENIIEEDEDQWTELLDEALHEADAVVRYPRILVFRELIRANSQINMVKGKLEEISDETAKEILNNELEKLEDTLHRICALIIMW